MLFDKLIFFIFLCSETVGRSDSSAQLSIISQLESISSEQFFRTFLSTSACQLSRLSSVCWPEDRHHLQKLGIQATG